MKDEILSELNEFLANKTLDDKSQVVYLMVQIRKTLDHLGTEVYPILRFYCNWTVHIKKDDTKPIQYVMNKIEQSINNGRTFNKLHIPDDSSALDFVSLSELKKEMEVFFKEVGLSETVFQDNNWSEFRHLLLRVLANQPINKPTNNISKVYFPITNKGAAILIVEFKNGKSYRFMNHF